MSEETKAVLVPKDDFTIKDLELIEKFKEKGLMGLHTLAEGDVERMMALYLDGKTYRQISNTLQKEKSVILYLAEKFNWPELRKEYLEELQVTMPGKILESKLQSQEFLMELLTAYKKKIGKNINKYLKTDDEQFADKIDTKDLNSVLKIMEILYRFGNENLGKDPALVGLNGLGEGVTITKTGANSVEITPKPSAFKTKLKQFADLKREQERASMAPEKEVHDISINKSQGEKENTNENE